MLVKAALFVVMAVAAVVLLAECQPKAAPVVVSRTAPYDSVLDAEVK